MRIVLQYFDDCPNWQIADAHLRAALDEVSASDVVVEYVLVDTLEQAEECGFHGSPTILVDGLDPFADESTAVGLACRRFVTESGVAGAPSVGQLVAGLRDGVDRR